MEYVAVAVVEVNEVSAGNAEMNEGQVVIFDGDGAGEEVRLVAQSCRRQVKLVFKPGGGVGIAVDVEVGVADHGRREDCLHRGGTAGE